MSDGVILGVVCAAYFAVVLAIAARASRSRGAGPASAEDYFLGGRAAKTLVLFMALFGTNVTPFVLMGVPGLAYHNGVGVFGQNAAIVALGIPLSFYLIGYPAWRAARETGAVTPAELYARRLGSPRLGGVMFVAYAAYTLPYVVTSVLGVGVAVSVLTADAVSFELAAAALLVLTVGYTALGGMRATMWTNVFQGSVFMVLVLVAFFIVADDFGGLANATQRVHAIAPALLEKGDRPMFSPAAYGSWALAISLTVIAFPHMLVRIFAAKDVAALKNVCRLYPIALVLLWLPAVMFGVWGVLDRPGLVGRESDAVFVWMVVDHLGPWLQGLALAAILAAVMSTIDAQFLTLSSMLTRDVLRPLRPGLSESSEVLASRIFLVVLAVITFVIVIIRPGSIFAIASFSFSGYVMLVPTLYSGLRASWFNARGAVVSIVLGNAVLLATWWLPSPLLGVLPVGWGLAAAVAGAVVGSRLGGPPPATPVEI